MNTKTLRLKVLVLTASTLVLGPLGAETISHDHDESENIRILKSDHGAANKTRLTATRNTKNRYQITPYIPPPTKKVAPELRTAKAGTRSPNNGYPTVSLLVPTHVALTVSAQPTLFWHISKSTQTPVVFTVMATDAIEPLLEKQLLGPVSPGIHAIDLADHGIRLATNKTYEWSVGLVEDPDDPSGDAVARSFIKRIVANSETRSLIVQSDPIKRAQLHAKNGIWHDALMVASENIPTIDAQERLRRARDSLLEQVSLDEVVPSILVVDKHLWSNL